MGVSLDDVLSGDAPPLKPGKKRRGGPGWSRLGCLAMFQTLVIVVLIALLIVEFQAANPRTITVEMVDASPLPPGAYIMYMSPSVTPNAADYPPILAAEPPVITTANADTVHELARLDDIDHMAWLDAGQTLVTNKGPTFRWYELYQPEPLTTERALAIGNGWPFAISPGQQSLAAANQNGQLGIWNIRNQQNRLQIGAFAGALRSVAYSHNGEFLAMGAWEGGLRVWDFDQATLQWEALPATAEEERFSVEGVDFSPDDHWLAAAGMRGNITIWDTETGAEVFVIDTGSPPKAVKFSPDGRTIAYPVASMVYVWDTTTQQIVHQLQGHFDRVYEVSFSPDGRLLASAGQDGNIILWDLQSSTQLRLLFDETLPTAIGDMAFSPDGRLIAAVYAEDGAHPLVLWGVSEDE